mmetsp:Transcript_123316/g.356355  ORF Transcript_123316/g.356355 Transcript_123316/m.356355 type:complete len:205 (+) Transcript_123316:797-1411(+)
MPPAEAPWLAGKADNGNGWWIVSGCPAPAPCRAFFASRMRPIKAPLGLTQLVKGPRSSTANSTCTGSTRKSRAAFASIRFATMKAWISSARYSLIRRISSRDRPLSSPSPRRRPYPVLGGGMEGAGAGADAGNIGATAAEGALLSNPVGDRKGPCPLPSRSWQGWSSSKRCRMHTVRPQRPQSKRFDGPKRSLHPCTGHFIGPP